MTTAPQKKGVALIGSEQPHYLDHLAPVCAIMDIPLVTIDEFTYQIATKYYPKIRSVLHDYVELTPEYLVSNYDVFYSSDMWGRNAIKSRFGRYEALYEKRIRCVHCPHGFSDKGFYIEKCADEDIVLIYGQNMLDLLKIQGVLDKVGSYVISDNIRYTYFKQEIDFYEQILQKEVLSRFEKPQPIILYAPTWLDYEQSTTFFDAADTILSLLPNHYNMIVQLHPRLELDDAGLYYRILGKYESKKNILFLSQFPPIYPLLAHTDIYLGDLSSIGYDFLTFGKPMFFLNKEKRDSKTDRRCYLFRCGVEVFPEQYAQLYDIIAASLPTDTERFAAVRAEMYTYTFGSERPFSAIKQDIIQAYSTEEVVRLGG